MWGTKNKGGEKRGDDKDEKNDYNGYASYRWDARRDKVGGIRVSSVPNTRINEMRTSCKESSRVGRCEESTRQVIYGILEIQTWRSRLGNDVGEICIE